MIKYRTAITKTGMITYIPRKAPKAYSMECMKASMNGRILSIPQTKMTTKITAAIPFTQILFNNFIALKIMSFMAIKNSLTDFTDRELLELLLCNQITISREVKRLYEKVETGKDSGRGQYWITFKKMLETEYSILEQVNNYLKDKEGHDADY